MTELERVLASPPEGSRGEQRRTAWWWRLIMLAVACSERLSTIRRQHVDEVLTLDGNSAAPLPTSRRGVDVEVLEGSVLVTQAGDARDYVLGPGDRVRFGRSKVAVMAFSPSRLRIRTAHRPPRDAERGSEVARGPCARSPSAAVAHEGTRFSLEGAEDRGRGARRR